jgi:hypothetical protein
MATIDTGFCLITTQDGPDTIRVTVQRRDGIEVIFCLSPFEAGQLARALLQWGLSEVLDGQ